MLTPYHLIVYTHVYMCANNINCKRRKNLQFTNNYLIYRYLQLNFYELIASVQHYFYFGIVLQNLSIVFTYNMKQLLTSSTNYHIPQLYNIIILWSLMLIPIMGDSCSRHSPQSNVAIAQRKESKSIDKRLKPFIVIASSPGSPIFSTHTRKDRGAWGRGYTVTHFIKFI